MIEKALSADFLFAYSPSERGKSNLLYSFLNLQDLLQLRRCHVYKLL